jgi:hypothetical protein
MRDEVLAVFREVADLSPEARARYFGEHPVDPDVRAEVESLLKYDARTGRSEVPLSAKPTHCSSPAPTDDIGQWGCSAKAAWGSFIWRSRVSQCAGASR